LQTYQLYGLDRSGAVVFSESFEESAADRAKARARALETRFQIVELWAGTVLVHRTGRSPPTPATG
jgi:hypothetical protein